MNYDTQYLHDLTYPYYPAYTMGCYHFVITGDNGKRFEFFFLLVDRNRNYTTYNVKKQLPYKHIYGQTSIFAPIQFSSNRNLTDHSCSVLMINCLGRLKMSVFRNIG